MSTKQVKSFALDVACGWDPWDVVSETCIFLSADFLLTVGKDKINQSSFDWISFKAEVSMILKRYSLLTGDPGGRPSDNMA